MNLMQNIFSSRRPHRANIIELCQDSYWCRPNSCSSYCCTIAAATLKSQTFFFWVKTKNPLMKSLTLSKTFPYLLIFLSTNSNLVTYLALYKEDQATHYPSLSHPLILKFHSFCCHISKHFHTSPSLLQNLFLDNNTTHLLQHYYPSLPHFIILKYHHFAAHKYISISFFYFSYKIFLLRKQHNLWHNTKNHSSSNYKLMYLLYLTFILFISYFHIFYKHTPRKISIHFSYIFKLHVSQSIYIQDLCSTKCLHTSHTYYKHHFSQNKYISFHLRAP